MNLESWRQRALAAEAKLAYLNERIANLGKTLKAGAVALQKAIDGATSAPKTTDPSHERTMLMAGTTTTGVTPTGVAPIDNLATDVAACVTVMGSAAILINGIQGQIQAGIQAALAGGATAAQLSVLNQVDANLTAGSQSLAAAVAANTPPATPPATPPSP
jgi:hypothetical protein